MMKAAGGLADYRYRTTRPRRVDRQLRGRLAVMGDPGSPVFVSWEDNLMRLFGSDRIAKMMDRMGLGKGKDSTLYDYQIH